MWEYLKAEPFDERYKIAAKELPEDKNVLDLNCGEAGFRKYYKYKNYVANDIYFPEDKTSGGFWTFLNCPDTDVDVKSDIIVCFGYGGGEFTGESLESKEAGNTIVRLADKYHPEYIVLEAAQKWQDDYKLFDLMEERLKDYKVIFKKKLDIKTEPDHYHNHRLIKIFKLYAKIPRKKT